MDKQNQDNKDFNPDLNTIRTIYVLYSSKGLNNSVDQILDRLQLPLSSKEFRSYIKSIGLSKESSIYPIQDIQNGDYISASNILHKLKYPECDLQDLLVEKEKVRVLKQKLKEEQDRNRSIEIKLNNLDNLISDDKERYVARYMTPITSPNCRIKSNNALLFNLADLHFGAKDKWVNSNLLKQRFDNVVTKMFRYDFPTYPKEIVVNILGDIFESLTGANVKDNATDLPGEEQLELAVLSIGQFIIDLYKRFDTPVRVFLVGGNHDRVSKMNFEDNRRTGAQIFFTVLKIFLKEYIQKEVVELSTTTENWLTYTVDNTRVFLFHGDVKIDHNNMKAVDLDRYCQANKDNPIPYPKYKLFLSGHYHNVRHQEIEDTVMVTVPSLKGTDSYSNGLALASRSGQCTVEITPQGPQPPTLFLA